MDFLPNNHKKKGFKLYYSQLLKINNNKMKKKLKFYNEKLFIKIVKKIIKKLFN